jgi:hypothetical protein
MRVEQHKEESRVAQRGKPNNVKRKSKQCEEENLAA